MKPDEVSLGSEPLENIIENYLYNPLSCGVYHLRLSLDRNKFNEEYSNFLERNGIKITDKYNVYTVHSEMNGLLRETLKEIAKLLNDKKDVPKELEPLMLWTFTINNLDTLEMSKSYLIRHRLNRLVDRDNSIKPLGPNIPLIKLNTALYVLETAREATIILDVISLDKNGLKEFESFIDNFSVLRDSFKKISERKCHTTRMVYNILPSAIASWISNRTTIEKFPDFIINYLNDIVNYWNKREWRTSIVLSAIIVETLLAELYEEKFHENAPDTPLGNLRNKVLEKVDIPQDILESIEMVNTARIDSVHRSGREVSAQEAMNSIRGVVRFIIWYFNNIQRLTTSVTSNT